MHRTIRRITSYLFVLACACVALGQTIPKPKIVVGVVIDQFRYDYLLRFRGDYHGGLDRLLRHGAVFSDAHYPQSTTVTAVGHSSFLTGAPPAFSGIVNNEWFDRETGGAVTSVSDPRTFLVGANGARQGSSPRRLMVSTVGDELKMSGSDSKVIGISIKDRSAILPAGHMADGAYWFDPASESWVTSTYYREVLPEWVKKINAARPAARFMKANWMPLEAKAGAAPFCTMAAGTAVRACPSLEATPWGNQMIEEFAEAAVDGENLGGHAGTDLLTVSFSSNDYVGHAVGPDDPEVRDIAVRTDIMLGKLLDKIEQRVGAGNMLVVLTADHGVAPIPEVNEARHMPGGRLNGAAMLQHVNDALSAKFGPGKWIASGSTLMPYFDLKLIESKKLDRAEVENVAADAVRSTPHIARVYTRTQLMHGQVEQDAIGRAVTMSFYAPRFGDLLIVPEPYYIFEAKGAAHGTPYDYDNHVPVIFLGSGIKPGAYREKILVNDIAPTLANMLGVETPTSSIGRVLSEILN